MMKITQEVAECVGLWLAEGDTKTKAEITFTNNSLPLIEFFGSTIQQIFKNKNHNPRIYVYSSIKENIEFPLSYQINYYRDKRATKPYFIFRLASREVSREWKYLVEKVKSKPKYYAHILRGFFAGEGNLKECTHSNRTIRIAQGKSNRFIENILGYYGVKYHFLPRERAYVITGKWNWDKLAKIRVADLHPIKRKKFWKIFNSFKEEHYPNYELKKKILEVLNKSYTSLELAKKFKRSQARIQDILIPLKKEGKLQTFKVRSKYYWIKADQQVIIISKVKRRYLNSLRIKNKITAELAKEIGVCWKSAHNRLMELQKLNLTSKDSNETWKIIPTEKEVITV